MGGLLFPTVLHNRVNTGLPLTTAISRFFHYLGSLLPVAIAAVLRIDGGV